MSGVSGVVYRPFGDGTVSVALADGVQLDSFGRLRVSEALTLRRVVTPRT